MKDLKDWAAVQRVYKETRSIRSTARILGIARNTVRSLLKQVQFAPAGGRKCVLERPLCGVQRPPAFSHLTTAFAY